MKQTQIEINSVSIKVGEIYNLSLVNPRNQKLETYIIKIIGINTDYDYDAGKRVDYRCSIRIKPLYSNSVNEKYSVFNPNEPISLNERTIKRFTITFKEI